MYVYVAQDWNGNVYITDDRDALPPDVTDFYECYLPEKERHNEVADLEISFERWSHYVSVAGEGGIETKPSGLWR